MPFSFELSRWPLAVYFPQRYTPEYAYPPF